MTSKREPTEEQEKELDEAADKLKKTVGSTKPVKK